MKTKMRLFTLFTFVSIVFAQSVDAQSLWQFEKAKLNYVDLSDDAEIIAQPVKTETIDLTVSESSDNVIKINLDSVVNSSLSGIGGAFNEQGGDAFMYLSEAERDTLAKALFSSTEGSGFSLCRTAVGSSDFGLSAYSYSETEDDYDMEYFSVERDESSVIPFILAAKEENPDLQMFASPWSPPGWMKESGKMDGGDENPDENVLISNSSIYQAYGLYFSKYVQAYAALGVDIDRLIVQNETDMNPSYPGCDMMPEEMSELITSYIAPQFEADGVETEIWAGSFRGARSDAQNFMALDNADDAVGVGLQYCGESVMTTLRSNYPDLKMMHTEGKCEDGDNSMDQARDRFAEIAMWLNAGCENYCYWNMVLNETSTSGWGWKQNSLINIDRSTGVVTYNPDYAPVSLLSQYIRPEDQSLYVESTDDEDVIAVCNQQSLNVFIQNDEETAVNKYLEFDGTTYLVELPAQSLCAITFDVNKVEAEDYTSMSGIEIETTTDDDGGENISSVDLGDWMEYEIYVPYSGTFSMEYRVASASTDGSFSLSLDGDTLEQVTFAATGGEQEWTTVSSEVPFYLSQGTQTIKLTANSDDWKLNWFKFSLECEESSIVPYVETFDTLGESFGLEQSTELTILPGYTGSLSPVAEDDGTWYWSGPNDFYSDENEILFEDIDDDKSGDYIVSFTNECGLVTSDTFSIVVTDSLYFEAEDYTAMDGVTVETTSDISGDSHVTSIASDDWMEYEVYVPFTANYTIDYRVAVTNNGAFDLEADDEVIDQVEFSYTGESESWMTVSSGSTVILEKGVQTLKILAQSDDWKINWIKLTVSDLIASCSLPYTNEGFEVNDTTIEWTTGVMDISCENSVDVYVLFETIGDLQETDYLNVFYKLDDGEKVQITNKTATGDVALLYEENLSGSFLEVIIESQSSEAGAYYDVSRISISNETDLFDRIEAEDYDEQSGIDTETCSDTDGGENVGYVNNNDWLMFSDISLTGVHSISLRLASTYTGTVSVYINSLDGTKIGEVDMPNTGGWQVWSTETAAIDSLSGFYDVYLLFEGTGSYVGNINWLQFSADILSSDATVTSTVYTVSQTEKTISDVTDGISVSIFEGNLEPADGATITTYQSDATTEAIVLSDGCKLIVVAEDGITTNTYTIETATTGIDVTSDDDEVSIYPNPVVDNLTITNAFGSKVEFYNAIGNLILEEVIESAEQTLNMGILSSSGFYLLKVTKPDGSVQIFKVIKDSNSSL
jgi:O-glycosyl hydrolase